MKRFLLLIREDPAAQRQANCERFNANIQEMTRWVEELAESGNYVSGEPLAAHGNYVRSDYIQSGGPFIYAREAVSGYVLIQAENVNQAAAIAQSCPEVLKGRIVIEVRPIIEASHD